MFLVRLWIIAFLTLSGASSYAAFWKLRQKEKDAVAECVLYLYLHENKITCATEESAITEDMYRGFLEASKEENAVNPKVPIRTTFRDFNDFKAKIVNVCRNGQAACKRIHDKTIKPTKLHRPECNAICSHFTCKNDLFVLSSCYAMSAYGLDGAKMGEKSTPICPANSVKKCLKNESLLPAMIKKRGWNISLEGGLSKNWGPLFFLTLTDPAQGRHLGVRIAQAGTVMGVMLAIPFAIHALWPALPILKLTWPNAFSWGGIKKLGYYLGSGQVESLQKVASDDVSKDAVTALTDSLSAQ